MSTTLPVYRVTRQDSSEQHLVELARSIFDLPRGFEISEQSGSRRLRSEGFVVELHRESGLVWAANEAQLWQPSLRPELPDPEKAVDLARRWAQERGLLPALAAPFVWGKPHVGGTHYAVQEVGAERQDRQLDVQVSFPVFVGETPVTGGGADVTVILGDRGRVIGFSGGWRQAEQAFDAKRVDREAADKRYRKMTRDLKLESSFEVTLAYYAAPPFEAQEFLYPVYVYQGYALVGRRSMALRQALLAATEFGPALPEQIPQPLRPKVDVAAISAARTSQVRRVRRTLATSTEATPFEAGASWIGMGLPGSQANAKGFVKEWKTAGWKINFNWGNENALESDWHRDGATRVDDADFVFYAGHADRFGWVLTAPEDGSLDAYDVSTGDPMGELWGKGDLEWMIIAACGPLHDDKLAQGGGNAISRWSGAFDGLHILMGYAANTQDNTSEGRRVSHYAKGGSSLIHAWFRTAKEVQPATNNKQPPLGPTVWAGAMWATKDGVDPQGDRAWQLGSVSGDPTPATKYHCLWSMC